MPTINHDDYLNMRLQEPEFQNEWLKQTIVDFANDGDYGEFFRALEQVIKARMTVTQFAEEIGINRVQLTDILHGKNQNPRLSTIFKILDGLGYSLSVEPKKKSA